MHVCLFACVFLVVHVMMLGPRRPVLSWMLEIFRAMAMRGPNTTCGEEQEVMRHFPNFQVLTDSVQAVNVSGHHNNSVLLCYCQQACKPVASL